MNSRANERQKLEARVRKTLEKSCLKGDQESVAARWPCEVKELFIFGRFNKLQNSSMLLDMFQVERRKLMMKQKDGTVGQILSFNS